jgi:orotate phosphoribosyltransferase
LAPIPYDAIIESDIRKQAGSSCFQSSGLSLSMDETTKGIIERIAIQFPKPTRIPSGQVCSIFYDCFQLTPNDLARLAAHAVGHLEHDAFDVAVGLAYSGILFAASVAGGRKVAILQKDGRFFGPDLKGQRVVVVDDVVHTGNRVQEAAERVRSEGGDVVGFACLIDRSGGRLAAPPSSGAAGGHSVPLWFAFQTEME